MMTKTASSVGTSRVHELVQGTIGRSPIRCRPQSIFSWNYNCESERHRATTSVRWLSEQGSIDIDGETFSVRKEGLVFPTWSLHHPDCGEIATAERTGVFQRRWSVTRTGQLHSVELVPSFLGRNYTVEQQGQVIAKLTHDSLFSRNTTITVAGGQMSLAHALFCFYLLVTEQRRQSSG